MSSSSQERWYHDPVKSLPTIRQAKDINDYQTPEEVKAMMAGKIDDDLCPLCGGPLPEDDDGGNTYEQ